MKTILIFHPVAPAAELLRGTLTSMGYPAKVVGPKEYGQPLGVLAGGNLLGFPTGLCEKPEVPVMVLCGLTEAETEEVLAGLRQSGQGKGIPKAVLTPTNQFWTISVLARELEKERKYMEGQAASMETLNKSSAAEQQTF